MLSPLFLVYLVLSAVLVTPVKHPHFSKSVEIVLPRPAGTAVTLTVTHLTATFDKKGFENMKRDGVWHLANAHFQTTDEVEVGGKKIAPGKYRILARKVDEKSWTLMLDKAGKFSLEVSDKAVVLTSDFKSNAVMQEHLQIDINPSGDKKSTVVNLEVSFDQYRATAAIRIP